jgi:hypothetical protein
MNNNLKQFTSISGFLFFSTLITTSIAEACSPDYQAGTNYQIGDTVLYNGYEYTCTVTQGRTANDVTWQCNDKYPTEVNWDYYWVRGLSEQECAGIGSSDGTGAIPKDLNVIDRLSVTRVPGLDPSDPNEPGVWLTIWGGVDSVGMYSGGKFQSLDTEANVDLAFQGMGVWARGEAVAGFFQSDTAYINSVGLGTPQFSVEASGAIRVGTRRLIPMQGVDDDPPYFLWRPELERDGDTSWYINSNLNGDFEMVPTGGEWVDRTWINGSNGDMHVGGNVYFDGGNVKMLLDRIKQLEAKVNALESSQ